jgi:hypothetical protein
MASVDWNAQIQQYLKIGANPDASIGPLLAGLGGACQAAVENAIGRTLDNVTYTEAYDGNGQQSGVMLLRHDPIVSITSASLDGSALTLPASFNPYVPTYPPPQLTIFGGLPGDLTASGVQLTDGSIFDSGIQNFIITYTAGLSGPTEGSPPPDLVFAIAFWASLLFKDRDRLGEASRTIGDQLSTFTMDIPPDIAQLIFRYERVMLP